MSNIDFFELSRVLEEAGCGADAAECHATLSGLICAGPRLPGDWMEQVTGGGDDPSACRSALETLEKQLREDLGGGLMAFDLMMPSEDTALADRAQALAHWCHGFLSGLTMGGIKAGEPLPGEVGEVVKDFSVLSRAAHEGEAEEEDELAYIELCEFVRVGTQLVYEELNSRRQQS